MKSIIFVILSVLFAQTMQFFCGQGFGGLFGGGEKITSYSGSGKSSKSGKGKKQYARSECPYCSGRGCSHCYWSKSIIKIFH